MSLSTVIKGLSQSERKLKIEGECVKRFTLNDDGSVDDSGSEDDVIRVSEERVTSLKGFNLRKEITSPAPDHEEEKIRYWGVVRDFLKQEEWIRESEKLPIAASANTIVNIMLIPFQSVARIYAWKDDGVMFMMLSTSKTSSHANEYQAERNQKSNLMKHLGASDDKSYKISKLSVGENKLLCISNVEAFDENDNEIKFAFRKVFADDKKRNKYYRYTYPRLVTTAAIRQIEALLLIVKNDEDCVEETIWVSKMKRMLDEMKKSPSKCKWSLQHSIAFLDRFLYLVNETLDWMDERKVASFMQAEGKNEIEVKLEEFDCDELTGNNEDD